MHGATYGCTFWSTGVALLKPTYNTSQHNHQQILSNSINNFSNSISQSFSKQRGKLSRTGSIVSQATHMQVDAISRTSEQSFGMGSLAGTEGVMFDDLYDLSNRAKLPRGVENIRPHLEHVDNVPLLVPLFTDCTPEGMSLNSGFNRLWETWSQFGCKSDHYPLQSGTGLFSS